MLRQLHKNWGSIMKIGITGYCKKYISEWKGVPYNNYAEREWRYTVPETKVDWIITEETYKEWRKDTSNKRPAPTEDLKQYPLKFEIDDIKGIIISDKKEYEEISRFLDVTGLFSGIKKNLSDTEKKQLLELVSVIPNSWC